MARTYRKPPVLSILVLCPRNLLEVPDYRKLPKRPITSTPYRDRHNVPINALEGPETPVWTPEKEKGLKGSGVLYTSLFLSHDGAHKDSRPLYVPSLAIPTYYQSPPQPSIIGIVSPEFVGIRFNSSEFVFDRDVDRQGAGVALAGADVEYQ